MVRKYDAICPEFDSIGYNSSGPFKEIGKEISTNPSFSANCLKILSSIASWSLPSDVVWSPESRDVASKANRIRVMGTNLYFSLKYETIWAGKSVLIMPLKLMPLWVNFRIQLMI